MSKRAVLNTIFSFATLLLSVALAFAAPGPPEPAKTAAPPVIPPPGLPIDENIFIGLSLALLLGVYVTAKYQKNKGFN